MPCTCRDCLPFSLARVEWPEGVDFSFDLWPRGDASEAIVSPLLCTDGDCAAGPARRQAMIFEANVTKANEVEAQEAWFEW